jgi:hypothetical protein
MTTLPDLLTRRSLALCSKLIHEAVIVAACIAWVITVELHVSEQESDVVGDRQRRLACWILRSIGACYTRGRVMEITRSLR